MLLRGSRSKICQERIKESLWDQGRVVPKMCCKKVVTALDTSDLPTPSRSDAAVFSDEGLDSVVINCERMKWKSSVGAVLTL